MKPQIHRGIAVFAAVSLAMASSTSVLAQDREPPEAPSVVVTTEVLGSVVGDLVGDAADVRTLMSPGADPHSWQPSARDSEALFGADLIVANGLDLEEGLTAVLEQAEADGVSVFHAADHVELRATADADDDHAGADGDHGVDHGHGSGDPHFWLDPLAMRDVTAALGPALSEAGVDLGDRVAAQLADLEALDQELRERLSDIPVDQRRLVTGHGALGYFADAYDFEIVGTVVPGLSSTDEPSARDISELVRAIRDVDATVIFTDVGTPHLVAEAVAAETDADLVELDVARLPDGGAYADLLRGVAEIDRQRVIDGAGRSLMDHTVWDARYEGREYLWDVAPNVFVRRYLADVSPGTAIDLAAGEGRNAVWLASQGWQVTAVDFSSVALAKAGRLATEQEVADRVDLVVADALTFQPSDPVDLVVIAYFQVSPEEQRTALQRAAAWLRPGGTVFVVAHDRANVEQGYGGPSSAEHCYDLDEACAALADLEITHAETMERVVETDEGPRTALDSVIIATRPAS